MISLVAVGYQHPELLGAYLAGVRQRYPWPHSEVEVIAVDVNPLTVPALPRGVSYLQLGSACYSEAVNRGLRLARGEFLVWGNDDLEVSGPFLEALITPLLDEPHALVGILKAQQHARDYVEGSLVAMRRQALLDIGYLDENFPGCFEDVDYSWRAAQAGYRLVEVEAPVRHLDHGRLDHQVGRSHELFRKKWGL